MLQHMTKWLENVKRKVQSRTKQWLINAKRGHAKDMAEIINK